MDDLEEKDGEYLIPAKTNSSTNSIEEKQKDTATPGDDLHNE